MGQRHLYFLPALDKGRAQWCAMLVLAACLQHISCGTGLQALTTCLRILDWLRRLGSNFAHITTGLGAPKMQLAHLIGNHQWEMPKCTGF